MVRVVSDDFLRQLADYGALPSQLVDLAGEEGPRTLRYVDFMRAPTVGRPPVVFESHGQPRAYVFHGGELAAVTVVSQWVRRVAFRGDADWVGVLRPGRLDVFRAALDGSDQPQLLPGLPEGPLLFPALIQERSTGTATGVRTKLLELLRRSITQAKGFEVGPHDALSLVGRALFWRFLIDRGLLDGLNRDEVCPDAKSWPACLTTKTNALKTFAWLDDTFNGGLLPFESPPRGFAAEVFHHVMGNIAHLATADGQLQLRLPNDWSEVNFAHVPVGLLSEVYEAYAHGEDSKRAKAESIFYTPRHIAEFAVEEALEAVGDVSEPRVLDPAAGAGVFLVAMFRALVARQWKRSGKKPSRKIIRRILNDQLTGFDINSSALRLAELALYLTAIELDPEEKPRPLKLLRFDDLREHVLVHKAGGVGEGSLAPVEERFRAVFDIVAGNPPWTAHAPLEAKKKWVEATRNIVRLRLGDARAAAFDFPRTNPDLPFVYRAMEWAKVGGSIALVTHARWLFEQSETGLRARRDLLQSVHVTGILNGTALRDTNVWPNVRHPFCLLFAVNEAPPAGAAFLFISPDLDRMPDAEQERMRLDWQDAREIEISEVIERPWTLKARFRGTPFDQAVLDDLRRRGTSLSKYLRTIGTELKNGYKLGGAGSKQEPAEHMHHLRDLKGADMAFSIDAQPLDLFSRATLHRTRPLDIYKGPLLVVHESMRADELSPRAAFSLNDLAFDERFDGASFANLPEGAEIAAYLQLVIQSSIFQHALLMLDGQFGIEREVVHLATIKSIPVVPWSQLTDAQRSRSFELSQELRNGMTPDLLKDVDRFVVGVFGFSNVQCITIADTLATALPTAAAKHTAVRPTTEAERSTFVEVCQDELRSVLRASHKNAFVRLRNDFASSFCPIIQIDRVDRGDAKPALSDVDPRRFVEAADEASASLVTMRVNERTILVGLLDRYGYWTRTRARMLAASLLSEPDAHG